MGIFKKKQPKGKNEIENKVLKENIVNAALAQFFILLFREQIF
ncbi:hypothetical protein [Eshraghiella crossota]